MITKENFHSKVYQVMILSVFKKVFRENSKNSAAKNCMHHFFTLFKKVCLHMSRIHIKIWTMVKYVFFYLTSTGMCRLEKCRFFFRFFQKICSNLLTLLLAHEFLHFTCWPPLDQCAMLTTSGPVCIGSIICKLCKLLTVQIWTNWSLNEWKII